MRDKETILAVLSYYVDYCTIIDYSSVYIAVLL